MIIQEKNQQAMQYAIRVKTHYLEEQSSLAHAIYTFAYTIHIQNRSPVGAQLISRHWIICNNDGKTQEVQGLGVVGKQPFLAPKKHFEYTSQTSISTPIGSMKGSYFFVTEDGFRFDIPVAEFSLARPSSLH
jgi:ApaG protein